MTTSIVLDYGHGGIIDGVYQTPGKRYRFTDDPPFEIFEGEVNRRVASYLGWALQEHGVTVFDAVKGELFNAFDLTSRDVPLKSRVDYANSLHRAGHKVVYISIHSNAAGMESVGTGHPARGIDVYTSKGRTQSDAIATDIYNACKEAGLNVRSGNWQDGDADHEANFYVLRKTLCPAVLIEGLFFSNRDDAEYLISPEGQKTLARAYLNGLRPVLGLPEDGFCKERCFWRS